MKKYEVYYRAEALLTVSVEAENEDAAVEKATDIIYGDGEGLIIGVDNDDVTISLELNYFDGIGEEISL